MTLSPAPTKTVQDAGTVSSIVDSEEMEFTPGKRVLTIFGVLCLISMAAALDATSLSIALPLISEKLHGTSIEAFWCGTSFLLSGTVFQPLYGSFSDIFGRRPVLCFALVFFTIGSVTAGSAKALDALLVGRSFQGIGAGGIISMTEILITDLIPLRHRGNYLGLISAVWAIGSVSGPIVGGALSNNSNLWRWIFYLNIPFAVIGAISVPLFLTLVDLPASMITKIKSVDWIGTIVFTLSMTSFLIGLMWGGIQFPWASGATLAPLLLGVAGIIGFLAYIYYTVETANHQPLIRLKVFRSRTAAAAYAATAINGILVWCALYFIPLYYEGVKGMTPLISGVAVLPETFTMAPAAIIAGVVATKTGRFRTILCVGWVITLLGSGLLLLLKRPTTTAQWIFLNIPFGIGTGVVFPVMAFAIQAATESTDAAYAVSMFIFLRQFGQTLGVTIGALVFNNALESDLKKIPSLSQNASAYSKDSVALVRVINNMPTDSPQRLLLEDSYDNALQKIWIVLTVLSAVGLVLCYWCEDLTLDKKLETNQGIKIENTKDNEKGPDG